MAVKLKPFLLFSRPRHFSLRLSFLTTTSQSGPNPTPTPTPNPNPSPDPNPDLVDGLCRVLSDFRAPHDDLPAALRPFASDLSPSAAFAVLRRCRHLPVPQFRFFLFAAALPEFRHAPDSLPALAASLAAARLFPLLRSLLSDLPASSLSHALFPLLFRAYARARLPADAIRAFDSMSGFGFPPTLADFHSLLFALSHNGLVEHAEPLFQELKNQFAVSAKTYTILIAGWAVAGKPENAQKLFDEMVERGIEPDVLAYNALIDAFCRGGDAVSARERLKEMQRERGLVPHAATYSAFLHAACAAGDARAVVRVLDRMKARGVTPNVFTYNAAIRLLCEKGEVEEAYAVLDEMTERGEKPDVWSYNTVLNAHCRLKEVNKALRVIARMDKDSCLPDRHTYNMLLKMLIGVGRIDRATEIWEGMKGRGFHPGAATYAVMIHGLCRKKGRVEEGCGYFERMVDEGIPPYLVTCELARERLLRFGLHERLEVLTDRMRRSTSCKVRELSGIMDGSSRRRESIEETEQSNELAVLAFEDSL